MYLISYKFIFTKKSCDIGHKGGLTVFLYGDNRIFLSFLTQRDYWKTCLNSLLDLTISKYIVNLNVL